MRLFLLLAALLVAAPTVLAQSAELHSQTPATAMKPTEGGTAPISTYRGGPAILFDQLQLVTNPGAGPEGADASALQTALGLDTYGAGVQLSASNSIADEFEVPAGDGWTVTDFVFFSYQTGASAGSSPFTDVVVQIWDGSPDNPASTIVAGNLTTNVLSNTEFSGIYRSIDTDVGASNRPIFANTATIAPTFLAPGTYWVQWSLAGTLASGPWQPPVTISGTLETGNALQFLGSTSTWQPFLDGGAAAAPQGAPFQVLGLEGVLDGPLLTVAPGSLDFGSVGVGESVTETVTLTSAGSEDIVISSIALTGQAEFTIDQSGTDLTLASGETTTFTVTYAPTAAGAYVGNIEISSNNPDGQIDIPLSGSSNVVTTFNGDTTGEPTFNRPNTVGDGTSGGCALSTSGTAVNYEATSFTVAASGDYGILATWGGFDGYLLLYQDDFDPNDACEGLIGLNDDTNGLGFSAIPNVTLSETDTYVVVATSFGNGSAGPYTYDFTGPGLVSFPTAGEQTEAFASELSVAPNPSSTRSAVRLEVSETQTVAVTVYDATGRRVAVLHDGVAVAGQTLELTLDTASLPSGVYVVRALSGADALSQRVTVIR